MLLEYGDTLQHLDDQLSEAAEGRGRLLIVCGGLTSGKTELLQEFAGRAVTSGALFLGATASKAHQSLQADVADQLFHSGGLPAETINRVSELFSRAAAATEPDCPDLKSFQGDAVQLVRDTCAELLRLSREQPLVIAVDDVQFADAFSLQLLLYLRRRMESSRILLVLSKWDWAQPTLPLFHAEITRHPHGWLRLVPLSESGIADLITQRTGATPEAGVTSAYYELTGGNPMLVEALIEDQRSAHRPEREPGAAALPPVGNHYLQAVLACLYRWDPQLLDVAHGLAVLGEQGSPALLSKLTGVGVETTEQLLRTLTTEGLLTSDGLLTGHRFRHPEIEKTILNSLPEETRSQLHLQAAELLYQHGSTARKIARHLAEANAMAGRWSTDVLREAAEQALACDEARTATEFLELALRGGPEEPERESVRMALARASWRINPSASALHLSALPTASRPDGKPSRQDAVTLVRHALWQGDTETVTSGLAVLEESGGTAEDHTAACLNFTRRWFYGPADDPAGRPAPSAPGLREHSSNDSYPQTRSTGMLSHLPTYAGGAADSASARRVLETCELNDITLEPVAAAILTLAQGGDADTAITWCETLHAEATRRDAITWQAVLDCVRAEISLRHGDLPAAAELAATAFSRLSAASWGVLIGYPLSILLTANTALDDRRVTAEYLRQVVPETMSATVWGLRYLRARGHARLAMGHVLSAVGDYRECGDRAEKLGLDVPALCPWRSDLAEANLRLGRTVVAKDLLTDQLGRTDGLDTRTRGISLRLLAASSDPGQRREFLEDALDCLQLADARFELSRVLDDMSVLHREAGEFDQARTMARRAAQEARICRSDGQPSPSAPAAPAAAPTLVPVPDHARAEADIPRRPVMPDQPAAERQQEIEPLSEAESRVATLAARGHTNREISGQLFITVSTVEQHLTRIYRKLGVKRRSKLPTGLASWRAKIGA